LLNVPPLDVTVTLNAADPPGCTVWDAGVTPLTPKSAGATPLPERATVCGDPVALSATCSVALKLAADAGVKVTENAQLVPAANEAPQVLVWAKSVGLVPPIAILVIDNAALPLFVSVTVVGALVVPVVSLEKATEVGASVATGAGGTVPVPVSAAV
jgi:hypothetical protein